MRGWGEVAEWEWEPQRERELQAQQEVSAFDADDDELEFDPSKFAVAIHGIPNNFFKEEAIDIADMQMSVSVQTNLETRNEYIGL